MLKELQVLTRIINTVQVVDETMPVQTLRILLEVARRDGVTISEIAEKTGVAQSSASRNVAALSEWHWLKRPGLGLVQIEVDRMELRKKIVTLTPKGKKLVESLVSILGDGRG